MIPNTERVEVPIRYNVRGLPPIADAKAITMEQFGADTSLGMQWHVLDHVDSQAKQTVHGGRPGLLEHVGPSDAVVVIDVYGLTNAP